MTPEIIFRKSSLKRWVCLGGFFGPPYAVTLPDGSVCMGCQFVLAMDVESRYILGHWAAARAPGPLTGDELIGFLKTVFATHRAPKDGVLISCSVWDSVESLYSGPLTRGRVEAIVQAGIGWPAMEAAERSKLESYVRGLGLSIAWREEDLPDSMPLGSNAALN